MWIKIKGAKDWLLGKNYKLISFKNKVHFIQIINLIIIYGM
jgi:hypothetical protein